MEDPTLHEESSPAVDESAEGEKVPADEATREKCEEQIPDTSAKGDPLVGSSGDNQQLDSVVEPSSPVSDKGNDVLCEIRDELGSLKGSVAETAAITAKTSLEIKEIHKLYHNEYAGRLRAMQGELDEYHKAERSRIFDDILSAIARIYGNNETLADEVTDPKTKKHIDYLLLDLLDLLAEYGVQRIKSSPGDKRNLYHSQVLGRVATGDKQKHDTVVKSHNSGFAAGKKTLVREVVDIYIYDSALEDTAEGSVSPVCESEPQTNQDN